MTKNISFKKADFDDIDTIYEIEKDCFEAPWSRDMFYQQIKTGISRHYIMSRDEKAAGFYGFSYVIDEAEILNFAVSPPYQNDGLGTLMMEHLISVAGSLDIKKIFLEVRVSNKSAIRMYEKTGFKYLAQRKAYYENGEDAYIMLKELKYIY